MIDKNNLPPIVHFQEISGKVGFPERNGPLIYLPFCNFRCDYCLNAKVVNGKMDEIPIDKILKHLEEFKESFIFISGGEPCRHKQLPNLMKRFKSEGLQVGISTNGTFFDELKNLIDDGLDFVAMDIKTDPMKPEKWNQVSCVTSELESVIKSISLINSKIGAENFGQEFRTTLFPPLVNESDLDSISTFINPEAVWVLQQFRARKGLLGGDEIANIEPYSDETLYNWLDKAKTKISKTLLRWP
jgi:anaerobic ribonucleoside-triphosphate reductase activating protein